jgi:hypothetical protein
LIVQGDFTLVLQAYIYQSKSILKNIRNHFITKVRSVWKSYDGRNFLFNTIPKKSSMLRKFLLKMKHRPVMMADIYNLSHSGEL